MSKTPDNLPKRTRVLVKDLLFQEKYQLTHSQTDLMSYIVNASYWAKNIDGFFVLATGKIQSDLPTMGEKTLEANLKALKEKGLIKTKLVQVKDWNGKPYLRGVKLTILGEEYNNHYITSMDDRERKEYKDKIKELEVEKEELKSKKEELEAIISNLQIPNSDTPISNDKSEEEKKPKIELKPQEEELIDFIKDTKKIYQELSTPICNTIPNWQKEVEFYINSYNKLTIKVPTGECKQVRDPARINFFWNYLYKNPEYIGKVIDYSKPLTCNELIHRYRGVDIKLGNAKFTVVNFYPKENNQATVELLGEGKDESIILQNKQGTDAIIGYDNIEKIILENRIK